MRMSSSRLPDCPGDEGDESSFGSLAMNGAPASLQILGRVTALDKRVRACDAASGCFLVLYLPQPLMRGHRWCRGKQGSGYDGLMFVEHLSYHGTRQQFTEGPFYSTRYEPPLHEGGDKTVLAI
jgi:hypothetical protein